MNKILILVILGLFFHLKLQAQSLKIGDQAPPFQVEGWLKNKPDTPLEKGKVHVVEFWATWCQPCLAGVPHLNKISTKYKDKGLVVYGISVMERKGVGMDSLERFMKGAIGSSMQYSVAVDGATNFMKTNWIDAVGQRGIPFTIVVDRSGYVAWQGHPNGLDKVLPAVLEGNWDLVEKRKQFDDQARLQAKDGNEVVNLLNPYMGKDYMGGKRVLDSLLSSEPDLLYYPTFGHFMTFCLIGTKSDKAGSYIRKWWESSNEPNWKSVSDAIFSFSRRSPEVLTPELYLLGAEALQAQLDNYPWSMDFKKTYQEMAEYYEKAGQSDKANELKNKATSIPNSN